MNQQNVKNKFVLKAYGRQKKGSWEDGAFIRKHARKPLGRAELEYLLTHQEAIPAEWSKKLVCFFGAIFTLKSSLAVMSKEGPKTISFDKEYVPLLVKLNEEWKLDSLALDDEFGPSRLSIEVEQSSIRNFLSRIFKI